MSKAATRKIIAPVTMNDPATGKYVPPGTEVELDAGEADAIEARFGVIASAADNPNMRGVDMASIEALNNQAGINKGNGEKIVAIGADGTAQSIENVRPVIGADNGPVISNGEDRAMLEEMTKPQLVEYAIKKTPPIELPASMNKDAMIDAIVAGKLPE